MSAADILRGYLARFHPSYTVMDVELDSIPGYLRCTRPCRRHRCRWGTKQHFHVINVRGVGYGWRTSRGRFVDPNKLWKQLKAALPEVQAEEVLKCLAM